MTIAACGFLPVAQQNANGPVRLFYQHGAYSNKAHLALWSTIINLDWKKVAALLQQEPGQPNSRLKNDGNFVSSDIKQVNSLTMEF